MKRKRSVMTDKVLFSSVKNTSRLNNVNDSFLNNWKVLKSSSRSEVNSVKHSATFNIIGAMGVIYFLSVIVFIIRQICKTLNYVSKWKQEVVVSFIFRIFSFVFEFRFHAFRGPGPGEGASNETMFLVIIVFRVFIRFLFLIIKLTLNLILLYGFL